MSFNELHIKSAEFCEYARAKMDLTPEEADEFRRAACKNDWTAINPFYNRWIQLGHTKSGFDELLQKLPLTVSAVQSVWHLIDELNDLKKRKIMIISIDEFTAIQTRQQEISTELKKLRNELVEGLGV